MSPFLRRLVAAVVSALLLLAGTSVTAEARSGLRVAKVNVAGQDWCAAKLRVGWKRVKGATYQVRWSPTRAGLAGARPTAVRRPAAVIGPLGHTAKALVQVRAQRGSRVGAWSRPRAVGFKVRWPDAPRFSGVGITGGVQFRWACTGYASRYRVRWAAAPYGKWPTTDNFVTGWLGSWARSATFRVPATPRSGDHMLAVPYANPVWGRLEAGNSRGGVRLSRGWIPVFPTPPSPGTGDRVRMGTYNVMLFPAAGSRANAIAANINGHKLDVVALQEANAGTADAVTAALGAGWQHVETGNGVGQQILFRTAKYRLVDDGAFDVYNPKSPTDPLRTPWALLEPVAPADPDRSQPILVVSVHLSENADKSAMDKKRDAGISATQVANAVEQANVTGAPVIVAGDLRYLREPFNDVAGYVEAPPTLVRLGYYDAMAAVQKVNIKYATVNGVSARQVAALSGVASRSDYLMLKGFRGSNAYVNVANWSYNGLVPSDHNLVYADLTVPFAN